MVKKFEEFINEAFLSKTYDRYKNGSIRKEDGAKVKTSLGVTITLHNPNYDYEALIQEMLNSSQDEMRGIDFDTWGNMMNYLKPEYRKAIMDNKDPYTHFVDGKNVVAQFLVYDEVKEWDYYDTDGLDEHDFQEIIRAVVEKLRNVDLQRNKETKNISLLLMDETNVYDYVVELDEKGKLDEYWFDDLKECMESVYEDIELQTWSYNNYGSSIGVEINYDNIMKYEDMKNDVKSFFEGLLEE